MRPWIAMSGASIRDKRLSAAARTLIDLLQPAGGSAAAERLRAMPMQAWEDAYALALQHNVASLLQRALEEGGVFAELPAPLRARFAAQRRATALDNLRNYGEFRRIAHALRERGIPLIALKGLHLSELVYRDISLRPMSDLDILVPRAQVEPALATLLSMEFELNGGIPSGYDTVLVHRRLDILVEVHWSLGQAGEAYTPPIEDIWRCAVPARLGDADALVMAPEFLLLHVCAHLAYHHLFAFDLRALCDIAQIIRAYPALDWDTVADQGRRHGWERGVAAALQLARDQLGAAVPAQVLAALGGDALDPGLLADALAQLGTFSGIPHELQFSPKLMALKSPIGRMARLGILWSRIFVPRAELALIYNVPQHSARLNFYYVLRLRDLLRRYASSVGELNACGADLAASSARNARLARWINGA